jgi:hypothetical protein
MLDATYQNIKIMSHMLIIITVYLYETFLPFCKTYVYIQSYPCIIISSKLN